MYQVTVPIPDAFIQPLDELVQQANAPSREEFIKVIVRNFIVEYQMRKDLAPQQQQKMFQLMNMWR